MDTDRDWPSVLGDTALDFGNTALAAGYDPPGDVLASVDVFLAWCRHVGLDVNATGRDGRGVLRDLDRLRRAIVTIALALADGTEVPEAATEDLRAIHADGLRHAHARMAAGLTWSWPDATPARRALYVIADQAVELFRHGPLHRVKACDDCRYAFIDTTKNGSRRWCSMDDCGKQAKMARYIARRAARARAAKAD